MNIFDEDVENQLKGFKTEPKKTNRDFILLNELRIRKPLLEITENRGNSSPKDSKSTICLSEPIGLVKRRRKIIQIKTFKKDVDDSNSKNQSISITASTLAKLLEYDTFIEDELGQSESDELKLLKYLEKEGKLSPEILKTFSKCLKIRNVNMTYSYADIEVECGQFVQSKYSPILCTKPFYYGFHQLLSLDFTNVKLGDDELRYLIRLPKVQALGLSGTKITDKGVKYLATYASFKSSLRCIKLCFVQGISDFSIQNLNSFAKLKSFDFRGCENLTLVGFHSLNAKNWFNIKLPLKIQNQLAEMNQYYKFLAKSDSTIIFDPNDVRIQRLSDYELKAQLKHHQKVFSGIFLIDTLTNLRNRFISILRIRKKEEILLQCCFN